MPCTTGTSGQSQGRIGRGAGSRAAASLEMVCATAVDGGTGAGPCARAAPSAAHSDSGVGAAENTVADCQAAGYYVELVEGLAENDQADDNGGGEDRQQGIDDVTGRPVLGIHQVEPNES